MLNINKIKPLKSEDVIDTPHERRRFKLNPKRKRFNPTYPSNTIKKIIQSLISLIRALIKGIWHGRNK